MSCPTTHVIFDFSGTLVDTITPAIEILQEFAKDFGKELKPEHIESFVEGDSTDDTFSKILNYLKLNTVKDLDFNTSKNELVQKYLTKEIKFNPGVEKFLDHLTLKGIPMAIATNLKSREFQAFSKVVTGFERIQFSHIVCGGDDPEVKANKPSPDVYLVCSGRFKTPPLDLKNCVIFEDSIIGLKGAIASGMKTVMLTNKYSADSTEFRKDSTLFIESFQDIKPEAIGLPKY